jgi:hypothetical protein
MPFSAVRTCVQVVGCVLLALASACEGPDELDGEVTTLIVQGVVEDEGGGPVAGAVVHVGWRPGGCDELLEFPPDTTAADGAFQIAAWSWGTFAESCVRVRAEPLVDRALREAAVQVERVPLHPKDGGDTLTLRLTLTPL